MSVAPVWYGSGVLGQGSYTFAEAARITGVPTSRLRRWVQGYEYTRAGERRTSGPVVATALRRHEDGSSTLTFLDLLEVLFVDRFLKAGVSMHTIRNAAAAAERDFRRPHAFCLRRFRTDGRQIFAGVAREDGDEKLVEVTRGQSVFRHVFDPLLSRIDYDVSGLAATWSPMGKSSPVVVDPTRAFGQPSLRDSGVRTSVLAAPVLRGHARVPSVANWYEVEEDDVRAAVAFEKSISKAA